MTKSTNPSALEDVYKTLKSLDLSSGEGLIFLGVEPSETEGESRLIATLQGNPARVTEAVYQAMTADDDLANIIQAAAFKFFMDSQETTSKN